MVYEHVVGCIKRLTPISQIAGKMKVANSTQQYRLTLYYWDTLRKNSIHDPKCLAHAMSAFSSIGDYSAVITTFNSCREQIYVTGDAYLLAMKAHIYNGTPEVALSLLDAMPSDNVTPSPAHLEAALLSAAQTNKRTEALNLFSRLSKTATPSQSAFAAAISVCIDDFDAADQLYYTSRVSWTKELERAPAEAFLKACAAAGDYDRAILVLQDLQLASNLLPRDHAFVVEACVTAKNLPRAYQYLSDSGSNITETEFGAEAWTRLIAGYIQDGKFEKAIEVLKASRHLGIVPIAIHDFGAAGEPRLAEEAFSLSPTSKSYPALVKALCSNGDWELAAARLKEMLVLGMSPSSSDYFPVIKAAFEAEDLNRSKSLLKEMNHLDIQPHPQMLAWTREKKLVKSPFQNGPKHPEAS